MSRSKDTATDNPARRRLIVRTAVIALAIALLIGSISITLAKYTTSVTDIKAVPAEDFHFTSDYLAYGTAPDYNVYTNAVEFSLMNFEGMKVTGYDVEYSVAVRLGDTDVTGGVTVSDSGGGRLAGGAANTNHITVSGLTCGETYDIEVVTEADAGGYAATLSARYVLLDAGGATVYEIKDYDTYSELVIYAGQSGTLLIRYDGFSPDNANPLTGGWMSAQGAQGNELSVAANTTYHLIFFGAGIRRQQTIVTENTIDIT